MKLLNKKYFSSFNSHLSFQKGFTLIELLVVIAVLGVLAAGVLTAINPLKQIQRADDSKIKNDIGQIVQALQAYYTLNQYYPANLAALVSSGDLKIVPTPPAGSAPATYEAGYSRSADPACNTAPYTSCEARIYMTLKVPKVSTTPLWCWRSATGEVKELADTTTCAP